MLIYVPHVVCVCECVHVSKILLIVHVVVLGGGEKEKDVGGGERFFLGYSIYRIAKGSHLPVSVALLCPLLPFPVLVVLQKPLVGL